MALRIRDEQLPALRVAPLRAFVTRVMEDVQRFFPARAAELGEGLRAFVEHGVARAEQHGLSTERQLCKYVGLTCVAGRDFDRGGRAADILGAAHLSPGEKLALVSAAVLAGLEDGGAA